MTDRSSSFFSSLASDYNTKVFDSSVRPVRASEQYAEYGFIAVLGLAQRLHVRFLPIQWQKALGQIGKGGQAAINEALINLQMSFAFKLFKYRPPQYPFREITQEMAVLCHPVVRKHEHIVRLEGICWDISEDDSVWPVLVFQKSQFGDLHDSFAKWQRFKNLSIEDKLNLCADVGIAIRDMHHNGIIHGDIKPGNVLTFEGNSRIIAKVADFGFATFFQDHNDLISMPDIKVWNAPEHHRLNFSPDQAKKMDVYSFGMLCFWLIFKAGSSVDLPLPPDTILESGQFMSFEQNQPEKNLIQLWKRDNKLVEWVCWLVVVREDGEFDSSTKNRLVSFFCSTLAFEPQSRRTEFEQLLSFLVPDRVLPKTEPVQMNVVPEQEDFEIPSSIFEFYSADFRLREFIVKSLKFIATAQTKSTVQHMPRSKAALQLALSHSVGFGTIKDDEQVNFIMHEHSLEYVNLQSQIQLIRDCAQDPILNSGDLFSILENQGFIQYIDLPQNYREMELLERAENVCKREIQSLQLVLDQSHTLCLELKDQLAMIKDSQGRWKEAEKLEIQNMATRLKVQGQEHPDTLTSMTNLASTYRNQGRWKEAEELGVQVMETRSRVLGHAHPNTLSSMINLALTFSDQGRWKEAEGLEVQVMEIRSKMLGQKHPSTLTSMANLVSTFWNQGRWKEAEGLGFQVMETSSRVLGQEHPDTLISISNLASTFGNQGRWKEAEGLAFQVKETSSRMLGQEHPSTLTSMINLATIYRNQGRWKKAEGLGVKVIEISSRVLGQEHPDTWSSMTNLASTYRNLGRWKEAERLEIQVMETSSKALGHEHPFTLISMTNLASTFWNQGRWEEAEGLQVKVMERSSKVLGQDHPSTLVSIANLASTFWNQGRWKEAEELEVQAIETSSRVLGQEHPDTLISIANLASTYRNQGRWDEAEGLEVQVMETSSRVLGQEHPDTLTSIANLALTFWNQGRWNEAEGLGVQVMETRSRVLGHEHPDTLISMTNLASTYSDQGRWMEAERLELQVMETSSRLLGQEHPDTLISIANLASTFWSQGRWKEAEGLYVQVVETRSRVLGEEHPDTLIGLANLAFTWKSQGRNDEALQLMEKCVKRRELKLGRDHPDTILSLKTLNDWRTAN